MALWGGRSQPFSNALSSAPDPSTKGFAIPNLCFIAFVHHLYAVLFDTIGRWVTWGSDGSSWRVGDVWRQVCVCFCDSQLTV